MCTRGDSMLVGKGVEPMHCHTDKPVGIGPVDAWKRGRRRYFLALLTTFVGVLSAFVPSIVVWLQTGLWHMNVIYKYTNPFQRLVSAHAITGLALLGLFAAQAYAGIMGKPGSRSRTFHRIAGKFIITPLLVLCLGLAAATEIAANLCCQEYGFGTTALATTILVCFLLGLRAAKQKRLEAHKDWMMWTTVLTCQVGLARIGMFAAQPFYKCDTFLSDWPFAASVWLSNLVAFFCLRSVGRFGWRYKANLFLFAFQSVIGMYVVASAITFECPPERILLGGHDNVTRPTHRRALGMAAMKQLVAWAHSS